MPCDLKAEPRYADTRYVLGDLQMESAQDILVEQLRQLLRLIVQAACRADKQGMLLLQNYFLIIRME